MHEKLSCLLHTDFVINLISYRFCNLGIYRALSKSHARYAVFNANTLPFIDVKGHWQHLLQGIFSALSSLRSLKTWKALFMKLPFRLFGIKAACLVLAGGYESVKDIGYPVDKNTETLFIHALDYDLYLKEKDCACTERAIAVFLDECMMFHPDYIMSESSKVPISVDRYYQLLNNFFDIVEEKTGYEVIIAAHPRFDYEGLPDYFKGRKCIRGKTVSLVKECKLVLAHSSTALNFANLFYKPAVFIVCSDFDKSWEDYWIRVMSMCYGKKPIFMDKNDNFDLKVELIVSKKHYDNYRRAYIKTKDSENLPFWQIVANRLKNE